MYTVSNNFIEYASSQGRQLHLKITWGEIVFNRDEIFTFGKSFNGDLYRTIMTEITGEVEGRHDLTDAVIKVEAGVSLNNSAVEWVNYGNFTVSEHTRIVGAEGSDDKTTFKAYDAMIKAHQFYDADDLTLEYPITVQELYEAIATHLGYTVSQLTITNGTMAILEDKYTAIENVTYRNILDDIAGATGGAIMVKGDALIIKYTDTTDFVANVKSTLNEDNMRSVSIKPKLKPVNIVNLAREPQHDNYVWPQDFDTIPVDTRSELVFANNQLMDKDREAFAEALLTQVAGLSYYPTNIEAYGILHFEPLDLVSVIDLNGVAHTTVVTSLELTFTSGIKEVFISDKPSNTKEQYALVTDKSRNFSRTYLIVDQQNGKIEAVVEKSEQLGDVVSEMSTKVTQTANKIEQEITERTEQANGMYEDLSSKITSTSESFGVQFDAVKGSIDDTAEELEKVTSHFRVNADGVIIGKSSDPIEFFAESNRIGFREGGKDIAYWEAGTMHVDNLIAIVTIQIGHHQISKYDSNVAGPSTVVRISD